MRYFSRLCLHKVCKRYGRAKRHYWLGKKLQEGNYYGENARTQTRNCGNVSNLNALNACNLYNTKNALKIITGFNGWQRQGVLAAKLKDWN